MKCFGKLWSCFWGLWFYFKEIESSNAKFYLSFWDLEIYLMDMFFWLFQNCHFYSYLLIVRDAKFCAGLENFSSKFSCAMIEIFGTVSSEWLKRWTICVAAKETLERLVCSLHQVKLEIDVKEARYKLLTKKKKPSSPQYLPPTKVLLFTWRQ